MERLDLPVLGRIGTVGAKYNYLARIIKLRIGQAAISPSSSPGSAPLHMGGMSP